MAEGTVGEVEFPKKGNIMRLLGEAYEDIRDALGEFITNSEDAETGRIDIRLDRKRGSRMSVLDDGTGMTYDELGAVPHRIGDSAKLLMEDKIGSKGIGILGFQAVADRCEIVSRARGQRTTYKLVLNAGDPRYRIMRAERPLRRPGTQVTLLRLRTDKTRLFALNSLVAWLKVKYRIPLLERRYALKVTEGSRTVNVRPESYSGLRFKARKVSTKFGRIEVELFVTPGSRSSRVGVVHRGRLVVKDISLVPEFAHAPWSMGSVQGEITNDFCKQTTGRGGFVNEGKKWPAWVGAVLSFEDDLLRAVSELEEERRLGMKRAFRKSLNRAFIRALREFDAIEAERARVMMGAPIADPRPSSGRPGASKRDSASAAAARLTGFRWSEATFPPELNHLHSRYDEPRRIIRINATHPDFERETRTEDGRQGYYVKLTAKEIIGYQYRGAPTDEQLEKMVQLELCAKRFFVSGGGA